MSGRGRKLCTMSYGQGKTPDGQRTKAAALLFKNRRLFAIIDRHENSSSESTKKDACVLRKGFKDSLEPHKINKLSILDNSKFTS